jgi:hypothetical protein
MPRQDLSLLNYKTINRPATLLRLCQEHRWMDSFTGWKADREFFADRGGDARQDAGTVVSSSR